MTATSPIFRQITPSASASSATTIPDQVGCIVLLRKGEATLPALADIEAKVKELNDPASGRMLPGVQIVPYYDRRELTSVTTRHRHRKPADWHGPGRDDFVHVPGQRKDRLDCGDQYTAGAAVCLFGALSARQIGESPLHRRGGLRHYRRFFGHHHREHLPSPGRRGGRRSAAEDPHSSRRRGDRPRPAVFDAHHGVRVYSLVHVAGSGGGLVRPHGADLRLGVGGGLGSWP